MPRKHLQLSLTGEASTSFVQPYLVLGIGEGADHGRMTWHIDVNGEILKYFKIDECTWRVDSSSSILQKGVLFMTPLLEQLISELAKNDLRVEYVGTDGPGSSKKPSHVLRNGSLFERIS